MESTLVQVFQKVFSRQRLTICVSTALPQKLSNKPHYVCTVFLEEKVTKKTYENFKIEETKHIKICNGALHEWHAITIHTRPAFLVESATK